MIGPAGGGGAALRERLGNSLYRLREVPRPLLAVSAILLLLAGAGILAVVVQVSGGGQPAHAGARPNPSRSPAEGPSTPRLAAQSAATASSPSAASPTTALVGKVVVIDPGHDGGNAAHPAQINRKVDAGGFLKECDTVGAETNGGYPEHAFTWDVANRVAALLRTRGLTVVLTRDGDTGVGPCIDARGRSGGDAHAAAAVSIHADGGPATGSGFHVIGPDRAPDGVNAGILTASARLATGMRDAYTKATGEAPANYLANQQGIVDRADLGGLNLSTVPKVFIECANMRNPRDAARVTDPAWREQAAEGIAAGIVTFLGAPPS
jgi:N-acetylmuramoyl-L-alanine amidase